MERYVSMMSIEAYRSAERAALPGLSNTAIGVFRPATFMALGYPVEVQDEAELIRYVDVMQESYAARYYSGAERYTQDEAEAISTVCAQVLELTHDQFGRRVRPWVAPLSAMRLFRVIKSLERLSGCAPLRVFELGPGSGYLGALLAHAGNEYSSMDVTQAFYLWQNRLYERIAPGRFSDLAISGTATVSGPGSIRHIPWWEFARFHEHCPISADIIVADHALSEMQPQARQYALAMANRMLDGPGLKLFLFESLGYKKFGTLSGVLKEFERAGFAVAFARRFWGLAPKGSALWDYRIDAVRALSRRLDARLGRYLRRRRLLAANPVFALDDRPVRYDPSNRGGNLEPQGFVRLEPSEAPADYPFLGVAGPTALQQWLAAVFSHQKVD